MDSVEGFQELSLSDDGGLDFRRFFLAPPLAHVLSFPSTRRFLRIFFESSLPIKQLARIVEAKSWDGDICRRKSPRYKISRPAGGRLSLRGNSQLQSVYCCAH